MDTCNYWHAFSSLMLITHALKAQALSVGILCNAETQPYNLKFYVFPAVRLRILYPGNAVVVLIVYQNQTGYPSSSIQNSKHFNSNCCSLPGRELPPWCCACSLNTSSGRTCRTMAFHILSSAIILRCIFAISTSAEIRFFLLSESKH